MKIIRSQASDPEYSSPAAFPRWVAILEQRIIPQWLPLLMGLALAVAAAYLIVQKEWFILFPLALFIPALVLFFDRPVIAVAFWLVLFPFVAEDPFIGSRYIYWVLHRAMLPGTLILMILLELIGTRKRPPIRLGWPEFAMFSYVLLSVGNILLLTPSSLNAGDLLIRYFDRIFVPFCMYGIIRLARPTEKEFQWLIPIAMVVILTQAIVGAASWVAPGILPSNWLGRAGERTVGTLNNPSVFSTVLLFCSLILFQAREQTTSAVKRLVYLLFFLLIFGLVFITLSRGAWLSGLVVWVGLLFLKPKVMTRLTLIVVGITVILGSSFLIGWGNTLGDRLTDTQTAEGRIIEGAATIQMIIRKPAFGWGYNTHELYDQQFRTRIIDASVAEDQSSHNTYLLIAAEMGLLGLSLYFFPAAYWLVASLKHYRSLPRRSFLNQSMFWMFWLIIASLFTAMMFTDLIQSTFFSTTLWWMVLAMIATMLESSKRAQEYFGNGSRWN